MADRPKHRYLVSVYFSDFVEADTEADAIDQFADRVLGGEIPSREFEWTIQDTQPTEEISE